MSSDSNAKFDIRALQSFMALMEPDQSKCYKNFIDEPLEEKHRVNKYLKHTEEIELMARPDPLDNECFLAYDMYPVNYKYSAVICSICGVTHLFHHVLYMSVVEQMKIPEPEKYLCDLIANIIAVEIPKLHSYSLKFVLCRDNDLNDRVIRLFSGSQKTQKYFNTFPFIRDPSRLKNSQLNDPYSQRAWVHIMHGEIDDSSVREIFDTYRNVATSKNNHQLKSFLKDYFQLAKEMLESRFMINLRLCTMERMDVFERIVRVHMKSYSDMIVSRTFVFDLIRALIHIYNC